MIQKLVRDLDCMHTFDASSGHLHEFVENFHPKWTGYMYFYDTFRHPVASLTKKC